MGDSLGCTTVWRSSWVMEDTADCSQRKALHSITAEMYRRESLRGGGEERKLWKLFRGAASAEYFYILLNFETSNILLHVCSVFPKLGGPESQGHLTWAQAVVNGRRDQKRHKGVSKESTGQWPPRQEGQACFHTNIVSFSYGKEGTKGTAPEGLVGLRRPLSFVW